VTHCLTAIISEPALIERARLRFDGEAITLPQGLVLLRLGLGRNTIPTDVEPSGFYNLHLVADALVDLSLEGPIAYVETEYFGGIGDQAAAVYRDGQRIYAEGMIDLDDPRHGGEGNINDALALLGVVAGEGEDEFDALGLGRPPVR
jgi:hypothetical protein